MPSLRAFLALEIPAAQQTAIYTQTTPICTALGANLRRVPAQNLHISLKFLGETPASQLQKLIQVIPTCLKNVQPFPLQANGLGTFPKPAQARVLWMGVHAPNILRQIARDLEATVRAGFEPDPKPFSPHITLGRLRQPQRIALETTSAGESINWLATHITLFRSDLRPSGAIYTPIHIFPFPEVNPEHA
jgi:RNA 2',3'-cyclic 3'-phosphodiesterase